MLVRSLFTILFFSIARAEEIVNLINPLWALPTSVNGAGNIAGYLAASIVGIDATATTYVIGCKPNATLTQTYNFTSTTHEAIAECSTDLKFGTFTQGSTSMHWGSSTTAEGQLGGSLRFTANYTFSKTLDPIVTATELLVQIMPSSIEYYNVSLTPDPIPTPTELSTQTRPSITDTYSIVPGSTYEYSVTESSYNATWYPITITAGVEKLTAFSATITPAPSSTSSSAGAAAMATAKWLAAALGGAAALAI